MNWDEETERQTKRVNLLTPIDSAKFVSLDAAQHVFVTGTTGYLGAFLLTELLQSKVSIIWCLVRCTSQDAGKQRIKDNLGKYGLLTPEFENRVKVVPGDLCAENLGISKEEWEILTNNVQIVFHLGAVVNYALSYQEIEKTTVSGTYEVIHFCTTGQPKALHFISTNAVFPLNPPEGVSKVCKEEMLPKSGAKGHPCTTLADGYSQSKYIAELIVYAAHSHLHLPCVIYRPGWIGPSLQTGASNPLDLLAWIVAMCIFIKAAPITGGCEEWRLESWPVDNLAQIIRGTAQLDPVQRPSPLILNAINEHLVVASKAFEDLQRAGHISDLVSQKEWRDRIARKITQLKDDLNNSKSQFSKDAMGELEAFLPMLDEYAHWLVDHKTYEQENTKSQLKQLGLRYPIMNSEAFNKQVAFLQKGHVFKMCGYCGI